MAKDINLTSQQWNDIIFEGKNKDYGAYELRQSSSKRHVMAFIAILILALFIGILPALADKVSEWARPAENISTDVVLANLDELDQEQEELDEMVKETAPPEPPLKSTIQFTAPEIVDASEIKDEDQMKAQDELADSKLQISIATVEGTDENTGLDIAELEAHRRIAEAEANRVYDFVEVLPTFPGGEGELDKFLANNVNYPRSAREAGIQGRVSVRFVVNKNGAISEVTIQRSPAKVLSDEAIRVIQSMPRWVPGKQNGKAVNVYFVLPIDFQLY